MKRPFLLLLAALAWLAAPAAGQRLNVLLITADDLGLQLSSYGETLIETPNLDRLASEGVRFQTAYVAQASCSPSRSAIFTGLHTHATGQYGLVNTGFTLHPRLQSATIPAVLERAGYRTGIIGKLHVAPEPTFPFDFFGMGGGGTREVRNAARQAGEFFAGEQPFFLMANFSDPHAFRRPDDSRQWYFPPQVDGLPENPIKPSEKTLFPFQEVDTLEQRERTANYYNAVQRLDAGVGMLLEELDQAGRRDDTLVIFVSDHGPPFARGKTTVYEAGLRVPFLVRWPGVSQPVVSPALVSTVDIAPTIYDAVGVEPPIEAHGRSLRPLMKDPEVPWRDYLVGEFHYHGARPFYPRRGIRDQRWKLIRNLRAGEAKPSTGIDGDQAYPISQQPRYEGTAVRQAFDTFADPPEYELYDLENDPWEFHNLAGDPAHGETLERMRQALEKWRKGADDPFLDPEYVRALARRIYEPGPDQR